MKGCMKKSQKNDGINQNKTTFDDWNDPKYKTFMKKETYTTGRQQKDAEVNDEIKEDKQTPKPVSSQTSLDIEQLRSKIKKGYTLLTKQEIRGIKLPFYESLLLNLKEDGYIGTHAFINDLILLDDEYHMLLKKDSSLKDRPLLKFDKVALNILCCGLMEAEVARRCEECNKEIKSLLTLALHFSKKENSSWHWLAEELFEQCVHYEDINSVELSLQAISKYLFASFLLTTKYDLENSKLYVEESMTLSEDKHWHVSDVTGEHSDLLYFESCILLHKILLEMTNNVEDEDSETAIRLCRNALHWAKTVNDKKAEASALLRLITIYLSHEIITPVLDLLENYMKICSDLKDVQGICEGYIMKMSYYELMEDEELVVDNMQELLKIAEEHKITNMLALVHRNLAASYLIQGNEEDMLEHAIKAYNYYVQLDKHQEIEETRCLTGIALAQENMSQYLRLVLEAECTSTSELDTLINWKMLHIPFLPDMKLLHPESKVNEDLKQRIEKMKDEEQAEREIKRVNELKITASTNVMGKWASRRVKRSGSFSSVSTARLNFQRAAITASLMRSTIGSFIGSKASAHKP